MLLKCISHSVICLRASHTRLPFRRAFSCTFRMSEPKYLTGDKASISQFIDSFDAIHAESKRSIGVLWSGEHLFENVPKTIEMLRSKGKKLVFVTNNSTKSRAAYKEKMEKMQIPCDVEEIFGSSYSAAIYISRILALPPPKNKVFVLGESGIEEELKSEGIQYVGGTDPAKDRDMRPDDFTSIANGTALDADVGVVLTGLDFHVNYLKLSLAYAYLQRGAHFFSTNGDSSLPNAQWLFPGAGSICAPLVKAIGREPTMFGKPSQAMMDAIEGKFKLDRQRTCMVGDRLNTDIAFGIDGKLGGTLAVLTGVSKKEEFLGQDKEIVPKYYVDKLSDLLD